MASGNRIRCRNVETEPVSSGKKRLGRQSHSSPASGTFAGPTKSLARLSPTMVLAQEEPEWMETRLVPFHPRSIGSPTASAEVGHGFAIPFAERCSVVSSQAEGDSTASRLSWPWPLDEKSKFVRMPSFAKARAVCGLFPNSPLLTRLSKSRALGDSSGAYVFIVVTSSNRGLQVQNHKLCEYHICTRETLHLATT